jgi:hypothetical protein
MTRVETFLYDNNRMFWESYKYVKDVCIEDAQTRSNIGPSFYTDHGPSHNHRMLLMLDHLFFDPYNQWTVLRSLTSTEAYIILCSIYAHDLGMRGTSIGFEYTSSAIKTRNQARKYHPQRSSNFIKNKTLIDWNDHFFPEDCRNAVATVCSIHQSPLCLFMKGEPAITRFNKTADIQFCAAVLKLLDCLDITNRRIGLGDMRDEAIPATNRIHYIGHYYVNDVLIEHLPKVAQAFGQNAVVKIIVHYSLPLTWKDYNQNDNDNDSSNPIYIIRALAEKYIRASHNDTIRIIQRKGLILRTGNDFKIEFTEFDVDGKLKKDFMSLFSKKNVKIDIKRAISYYKGELDPNVAGLDTNSGMPLCEEAYQVALRLIKYPDLPISAELFYEVKFYKIVLCQFCKQNILQYVESNNIYRISSNPDIALWGKTQSIINIDKEGGSRV